MIQLPPTESPTNAQLDLSWWLWVPPKQGKVTSRDPETTSCTNELLLLVHLLVKVAVFLDTRRQHVG